MNQHKEGGYKVPAHLMPSAPIIYAEVRSQPQPPLHEDCTITVGAVGLPDWAEPAKEQ